MNGPEPYFSDDMVTLHLGDCLEVLAAMEPGSVDAAACDPPYDLTSGKRGGTGEKSLNPNHPGGRARITTGGGFMGQQWDATGVAFDPATWRAVFRVLKPGGWLLAFGGTRTWHRLACAIEDAGFEYRDTVADLTGVDGPGLLWVYGSGFPKSLDVSKAIDKAAGAEREVIGERSGGAALKVGGDNPRPWHERQAERGGIYDITAPATTDAARWSGWGTALKPAWEPIVVARKPPTGTVAQNVIEHGTGALNIDGCRVATGDSLGRTRNTALGVMNDDGWQPQRQETDGHDAGRWPPNVLLGEEAAAEMDRQSGVLKSGANPVRRGSDKFRDAYGEIAGQEECTPHRGVDRGGASRFFPVFRYEAKANASERPRLPDGTAHPTVKPVDLMRWLVRLVTPPGGIVLDPFAGTGTTGEACIIEGFRSVLIERDPKYAELIMTRLRKPIQPDLFGGAA